MAIAFWMYGCPMCTFFWAALKPQLRTPTITTPKSIKFSNLGWPNEQKFVNRIWTSEILSNSVCWLKYIECIWTKWQALGSKSLGNIWTSFTVHPFICQNCRSIHSARFLSLRYKAPFPNSTPTYHLNKTIYNTSPFVTIYGGWI